MSSKKNEITNLSFNNYEGQSYIECIHEFINAIDKFTRFAEAVKETYYLDKDVEVEFFKKQRDLEHDLEFLDLGYHEIAKLGKEIRSLRRHRRGYKNDYLLNEGIKEFVKDNNYKHMDILKDLKSDLRQLINRIEKDLMYIENQKYTERSTVENIMNMKKDDIDNEENKLDQDLISLNRILNKFAINVESYMDKEQRVITAKLQLSNRFGIKSGKEYIINIGNDIEQCFKPRLQNIICETSTSDMCIPDPFGKNTLSGIISILSEQRDFLYDINITIREGKKEIKSKKSGRKKKK